MTEFATPVDCIRARMARAEHTPAMVGSRPGELQRHCVTCCRWTYAYGVCNHFREGQLAITRYCQHGGN